MILDRDFYKDETSRVAKNLLGKIVVRSIKNKNISGLILETEAYDSEQDLACHAKSGRTKRNEIMYGEPGHAYIYFTYGMHWMLNCVTRPYDYPAAVLLRAIFPIKGLDIIELNRKGIDKKNWCNGPAKLTKALLIDNKLNGIDLCDKNSSLRIIEGIVVDDSSIASTPRIGIDKTPEPWKSICWRYLTHISDLELKKYKNIENLMV